MSETGPGQGDADGAPGNGWALGRDRRRLARTLRDITLTFVAATTITLALSLCVGERSPTASGFAILGAVLAILAACLVLIRRGALRTTSWVLVGMVWAATTLGLVRAGDIGSPGFSFYAVGIVAAGLLLGARAAIAMAVVSGLTGGALLWATSSAALPSPGLEYSPSGVFWVELILFLAMAGLVSISIARIRDSMREAEESRAQLELRHLELERTLAEVERAQEIQADLEAKLAQTHRLESLGRLAGGVAHDFNNLLVVIQGYAEMIEQDVADEELRDAAVQIRAASGQAAGLTSQLLAFGRKQAQRRVVLDLNELVARALGMLRRLLREDIEIVPRLEPDLPLIEADEGQLHQVLMNLVANARDAMPRGGSIRISTRQVPGAPIGARRAVELRVEDDGEGMSEETQRQIFDPFFTTKGRSEGTGLGLASVYGIVEQCRGAIDVTSELGRGTTLTITLPAADEHARRPEPPSGPPASGSRAACVLLVEDHAPVRRIFARLLAADGHQVVEAQDGVEALAHAEALEAPVDLLLTDVVMPRMDGPALAATLRARWPGLRVLYTTGYSPEDLSVRIGADPLADLLPKPFDEPEVRRKVEALLAMEARPVVEPD